MDKLNFSNLSESGIFAVCGTLLILTGIICIAWFHIHDRSLMADNMNRAIEKGIDPLSVRCSYVKSDDIICVAFAASAQSHNVAQQALSKK